MVIAFESNLEGRRFEFWFILYLKKVLQCTAEILRNKWPVRLISCLFDMRRKRIRRFAHLKTGYLFISAKSKN